MDQALPRRRLGAQVWLERSASPVQVRNLMRQAAVAGLSDIRIFLMWPWIEARRGVWDFHLFDLVLDAAAEEGLSVKATLTANSGPWWLGTGGVLHTHTRLLDQAHQDAAEQYVRACVERYRGHRALGQWILWNEPMAPAAGPGKTPLRVESDRLLWSTLLRNMYPNLSDLNNEWLTGYDTFGEVPYPEAITHPAHQVSSWRTFGPRLAEIRLRAHALAADVGWLNALVKSIDPSHPTCINPNLTLANHAQVGYDLAELAHGIDLLGASFHAPWHFTFAEPDQHLGLVLAGVSLLAHVAGPRRVEVTELQLGNTYLAGAAPLGITPRQVAAGYLAPLLAGAESVTGWSLNARRDGFEAGEWGMLDDQDGPSDRSRVVVSVRAVLDRLDDRIGPWTPEPAQVWVILSARAQAVELLQAQAIQDNLGPDPARDPHRSAQGAALLVAELLRHGQSAALVPSSALTGLAVPPLLIIPQMVAWDRDFADRLLKLIAAGRTLILDGLSGQFDPAGAMHQPWPGGLEEIGLRSRGLLSRPDGRAGWAVTGHGAGLGQFPTVLADWVLSADWSPAVDLRIPDADDRAAVWSRTWGNGRVIVTAGSLAGAALNADSAPLVRAVLALAGGAGDIAAAVSPNTVSLRVRGASGWALGLFRVGFPMDARPIRVNLPPGDLYDLWSQTHFTHPGGERLIPAPDGIALLTGRH